MFAKGFSRWFFITSLSGTLALLAISLIPAHAQSPTSPAEPKCISCHEDMYFLHDTGKWFCLKEETPMTCVGCHGGDETAITKEVAHANRAVHPIVNENISKCMECHPEQGGERVEIFAREAGISLVMVSQPYTPVSTIAETQSIPVTGHAQNSRWFPVVSGVLLVSIATLALIIYILVRVYRRDALS